MIRLLIAAIAFVVLGAAVMVRFEAKAVEADPLALPCTVGACTSKVNPYSGKTEYYDCKKCGSETCWIMRSTACPTK